MTRDEAEAAYFALLRAREELDDLRRYDEFLAAEAQRLRRCSSEGRALAAAVPNRLLRALRHTEQPLTEAVDARLAAIADERGRVPDRIEAAERFVEESEREHAQLKYGR